MSQMNIHITPGFKQSIERFMRIRCLRSKSEAIRVAVEEGLQRALHTHGTVDFDEWIGLGLKAPLNPRPRFAQDADLWG